jgi:hypothetical protein
MMNAIVRPDVYERDRIAVRGEPFIQVTGTLARDDGTVNLIAEEIKPLNLGRTDHAAAGTPYRVDERPFSFLKDLRRHAPSSKNWA